LTEYARTRTQARGSHRSTDSQIDTRVGALESKLNLQLDFFYPTHYPCFQSTADL
jgi:hypothetical protein